MKATMLKILNHASFHRLLLLFKKKKLAVINQTELDQRCSITSSQSKKYIIMIMKSIVKKI